MTAAVVVARRAVGQGRARRVWKMWLLPGTFASFWQCRVNRVMQPAVPLRGHRRSFLFAGVYHPATGSQAAATLRFVQTDRFPKASFPTSRPLRKIVSRVPRSMA